MLYFTFLENFSKMLQPCVLRIAIAWAKWCLCHSKQSMKKAAVILLSHVLQAKGKTNFDGSNFLPSNNISFFVLATRCRSGTQYLQVEGTLFKM